MKIMLDIKDVNQWFGDPKNPNRILHDIDLKIVQGQFVALVGASGCGKSTLLRAILGTDPQKSGKIETDGHEVLGPNRHVGIVYQKYGLYQFLTAQENVAFGLMLDQSSLPSRSLGFLKWRHIRKSHLNEARDFLHKLKLGHACNLYPNKLSGGMQQRVAIAQSLIMKPKILLLDEPFGALDESTREDLQVMLLRLYAENIEAKKRGQEPPWTVIFVTHELNEAFYISDRLIGLSRNWYEDVDGVRVFGKDVGATKVWDKSTPVYHPDAPKDFEIFQSEKLELKEKVLNDTSPAIERNEHISFWSDLSKGVGTGVAIL
jgi:NitT/TauT family transport system ATP-binding protein